MAIKKLRKPRSKVKDEKIALALKDVKSLLRQYERATAVGHVTLAVNCADAIIPAIRLLRTLAEKSAKARYGNDFEVAGASSPRRYELEMPKVSSEETDEEDEDQDDDDDEECNECEVDCNEECSCECHDDQENND